MTPRAEKTEKNWKKWQKFSKKTWKKLQKVVSFCAFVFVEPKHIAHKKIITSNFVSQKGLDELLKTQT